MIISNEYAEKELLRLGVYVDMPKDLFHEGGKQKFTVKQALDHALADKRMTKLNITKKDYVELIIMLIKYKADMPGASKELEDRFFPTRWQLRIFTELLTERGHYYMSTERLLGHFGLREEE
ncbi:MAG: hypothetical protein ACI3T9_00995 [Romboutsia timonensis]